MPPMNGRIFLTLLGLVASGLWVAGCRIEPRPDPEPAADTTPAKRAMVDDFLDRNYKWIPIRREMAGARFYVDIVIDGHRGRLLLDTGAQRSLIAASSLNKFGLTDEKTDEARMQGVGGTVDISSTRFKSFLIGDRIAIEPGSFKIISTRADFDADGFLGIDLLHILSAVIDFKRDRLYFLDPGKHLEPPLSAVAERASMKTAVLRRDGWQPLLPVRVRGITYYLRPDTGAAATALTKDAADDMDLDLIETGMHAKGVGAGKVSLKLTVMPRVVLGEKLILRPGFCGIADHDDAGIVNYGGLLGVTVLSDNDALFDTGAFRIHFDRQRLESRFDYDKIEAEYRERTGVNAATPPAATPSFE